MSTTTQEHPVFGGPDVDRAERRYDRVEAWLVAAFAIALLIAYVRFVA